MFSLKRNEVKNSEDECKKESSCANCDESARCEEKKKNEHEEKLLKDRMRSIRHRVMVMSGKGGVGKSTVAVNLAMALAHDGYAVGILDADLHGPNIPKMLGLDKQHILGSPQGMVPLEIPPGVKVLSMAFLLDNPDSPVIWRGPLKHGVIKQFLSEAAWGDLDFLVVDLPPGTGDEPLSVAQMIKGDAGSVVVTTPQSVALLDSRKAVTFSRLLGLPVLGVVENMSGFVCPHCGGGIELFKTGGGEKAALELGVPFLGRIPIEPEIVTSCDDGWPFVLSLNGSAAEQSFKDIAKKVASVMEK
ncbi:MAG: Mrp/NBP35 family ATP-binding protein [Deltaproteobacteria bacterium]|nr:Mrp/NBP35 family ATP-binding protein [Deltaproteobacteria bacterium]MBW2307996.1 Mrp/NBP35 family ATP-binding protein [Deltaproteobacteria bacterium]